MNLKDKLAIYAKMIVEQGVALERGQKVLIRAFIDSIQLVRLISKEAYKNGASNVVVIWSDDELDRDFAFFSSENDLATYPKWQKEIFDDILDSGGVSISVRAPNSRMYDGVPKDRLSTLTKTTRTGFASFSSAISSSEVKWVVVNAVSKAWATQVYPSLIVEDACEKLWDDIFYCCKLNEPSPQKALSNHARKINETAKKITKKQYKKLLYVGPGTDLEVVLPENHLFVGGGNIDGDTVQMSNIPTYEIASLPHKYGVNGRLSATLPLVYNGNIIENFWFEFKDGKVIDYDAKVGRDAIASILSIDEGASYLGEVAIVSQDSEIASLNKLFYSTLLDENASCHFALGSAYPTCLVGAKGKSKAELEKLGVNTSITHVDFMVGSFELDIIGVFEDGSKEFILKNGVFSNEL
ncbi:aminopeptidase [Mycoplasmatota bacterium]|nr:aminopeptidase [Mycoplasmatota bacterium]